MLPDLVLHRSLLVAYLVAIVAGLAAGEGAQRLAAAGLAALLLARVAWRHGAFRAHAPRAAERAGSPRPISAARTS